MRFRTALIWLLAATATAAAPASAAEVANHPFLPARTLTGAKTLTGSKVEPPVVFQSLCGAAVNLSGDVFTSDYYRHMIDIWPAGGGHLEFPVSGADGPCAIAIDSENTVYVNLWHGPVIRYPVPYEFPEPIFLGRATGVAVDPLTDDVYIDEGSSIGRYASPVGAGTVPTRFGQGSLVEGFGVAFSYFPATEGQVYAADAATGTIKVYDGASPTVPLREIDGAGTPQGGFVSLFDASLATDQSNGHLFVVDNTQPGFEHSAAVVDEFTADGSYRGQLAHPLVDGEPTGIAVNEATTARRGEVYVTSGNGSSIVYPPVHEIGEEASLLYGFGPAGAGQALTVTRSGAGSGTVSSSPSGINCGTACEAEFNGGATVTLTASPAPGSVFSGWSGACSGSGTCQLVMTARKAVGAEFSPAPPMALSAGGSAAAALLGDGSTTAPADFRLGAPTLHGDVVTLPVTAPAAGTLVAGGAQLRQAETRVAAAGPARLLLRLNRKGRLALARGKNGRLTARVTVSFVPVDGGAKLVRVRKVVFGIGGRAR